VYEVGGQEIRALDEVTLAVDRGEFIAIVGAYLFEGLDVADATDAQLAHIRNVRVGFVFQSFNLLPRTSALENVAIPLDYLSPEHLSRQARRERATAALARMGLAGMERRTPGRLSGGQQQRVAIARALVNSPTLILADEPTGNLDTATSHAIMDQLKRLNRERGITIILVTHEEDIAAYADRVITMRDGRIVDDRRAPGA
jgi:macrolide transport system ATP-binding/permease protein